MAKRFITPFAQLGDRDSIPNEPIGNEVNYQTGYPAPYESDPETDPDAKFVERDKTNQLYNDITSNIKHWQENTYPEFITAADNGGTSFSYSKGNTVTLGGNTYVSLVDGNITIPPSSSWFLGDSLAENSYNDNGGSVQDFINDTTDEINRVGKNDLLKKKQQVYSADKLLSTVQTSGAPSVLCNGGAASGFVELVGESGAYADIEVFFEFEYLYGTLGVDFSFNGTSMDDLNRTNSGTIGGIVAERVSGTTYKVTTTTPEATKNFAGWSVRTIENQNCSFKIRSISIVEAGTLTAVTDFSILSEIPVWNNVVAEHSGATSRQRVFVPESQGDIVNCDHCEVSPSGSSEFGKPPYDISYYLDTLAVQPNTTKNVKMQAGKYYPYRKQFYIRPNTDVNLVAVGGKVEFLCGTEIPTSTWSTHQEGPTVYVRKAPYDPDRNHSEAVRNNTAQPQVAAFVPETKERSVLNYAFESVDSIAEVEASAGKTYFDGTDLYFSFGTTEAGLVDECFVYVCEVDIGISLPAPSAPTNLSAFNIHVTGCKDYNWRFRPDTLGTKLISLHDCGAYASATNEGYSIDRINSELVDCSAHSNRLDDFNFHDGGYSLLIRPYSRSSGDDGISHHETCESWIESAVVRYPASAFSIPAFGAKVIHNNCIGYAATSGTTSGKAYEGAWCVLSGEGQDSVSRNSYAAFNGCANFNSPDSDYYAISQASKTATLDVNKAITENGELLISESGSSTVVTNKN